MHVRRVHGTSLCVPTPREWASAHSRKCVQRSRAPAAQCAADTGQSRDKYRREQVRPKAALAS